MQLLDGWWHAAYREKSCGTLLTDKDTPFRVVKNRLMYCAMDPFAFTYNGTTYLFAELYSFLRGRGVIGYCSLKNGKFTKWKPVIVEPHHLSYPYLFEKDGKIYMIPESFESGQVYAYRAVEFPDRWERAYTLKSDVQYVDTSRFVADGQSYAFTYDIGGNAPHSLLLYRLADEKMEDADCQILTRDDAVARPGGYPFQDDKGWIRVSQDCDGQYGKAVVFSRICDNLWESYSETPILHFGVEDVRLDKKLRFSGIHTYTACSTIEVIDLKGRIFHPISLTLRILRMLKRLITRKRT